VTIELRARIRSATASFLAITLIPLSGAGQAPRLEPLGRYGCSDCAGPLLFEGVEAVTVSPSGEVIVVDRGTPRVRVLRRDGILVTSFGRSGAGPGEIGNASAVTVTPSGELWVVDSGQGRLQRLGASGADRGTTRLGGFATAAAFDPAGTHSLIAITGPRDTSLRLLRLAGAGTAEVGRFGPQLFPRRANNWEALPFAVSPNGAFAVGDGRQDYLIHTFTADGKSAGAIRRDIARQPLTAAEVAAEAAASRARASEMATMLGGRAAPPQTAEVEKLRDHFGASALRYDELGRLWVRVERGASDSTTFDVFGPERRYLGEVTVNARVRDFALGAGLLAGVVLDALDVQKIGIWQVTGLRD
jgi:hypothetical protein